jgi:hypothetical protein
MSLVQRMLQDRMPHGQWTYCQVKTMNLVQQVLQEAALYHHRSGSP